MEENEIWKPVNVEGFEHLYLVSNFSRVKSVRTFKGVARCLILKPASNTRGYLEINLCKNGVIKRASIHRLVAGAFIPNPENKPEVNHINLDKRDNSIGNLEWATGAENIQHACRAGAFKRGAEKRQKWVYTVDQVREVKRLLNEGFSAAAIQTQQPIGLRTIFSIKNGTHWKRVEPFVKIC